MEEDFSKYKLLILPDVWRIDASLESKINDYLKNGGKLLLSGVSGLDENDRFVFDTGIEFTERTNFHRPISFRNSTRSTAPPNI